MVYKRSTQSFGTFRCHHDGFNTIEETNSTFKIELKSLPHYFKYVPSAENEAYVLTRQNSSLETTLN